jgi:hypothetical protein
MIIGYIPGNFFMGDKQMEGTNYIITVVLISCEEYNFNFKSTFDDIDTGFKQIIEKIHKDNCLYHFDRSEQKCTYIPLKSIACIECTLED